MGTLIWTQIETGHPKPQGRTDCSLNVTAGNQLVLHGGFVVTTSNRPNDCISSETWILDLPSQSWRPYASEVDDHRCEHSGTSGVSNDIVIVGGIKGVRGSRPKDILHVLLEPKTLQQLAMKTVYKYRTELPWKKCLPRKLTSLMITDIEYDAEFTYRSHSPPTRPRRKIRKPERFGY